jgi:hypothetical protein
MALLDGPSPHRPFSTLSTKPRQLMCRQTSHTGHWPAMTEQLDGRLVRLLARRSPREETA